MISLLTLGSIDLRRDGRELSTVLAQPKRLALLAYLCAARPRGYHSRDALLALFWPESDTERARNSLRQALHHLRRTLGEDVVLGRGEREIGVNPSLVDCDAARFDDAIEAGRWEEAVALYRGDFLPALFVQDAPEAERWIAAESQRRRRDACDAAWRLADAAERSGDLDEALRRARWAAALEPEDEAGLRRLLTLLAANGDQAGVAAAFEAFAQRMRAEYDAEPSPRTSALFDSLRLRPPAAAGGSGGAGEAREDSTSGRDAPPGSSGRAPADLPDEAAAAAPPARRSSGARWALVAVTVVALALAGWWAVRIRAPRVAAPEPTIAVLPFLNMSGDPSREYLADGITEELLNLLAQVNGLQVAARTSAFAYKNSAVPVDSIGRALRVRHVLEGSVRESGERLRITAQLIDARSGYHLWSGTFDARLSDLFAVQDSIGRAIVDRLRPQLASGAVRGREARDPLAHVAVMMGWSAFRKNSAEAYRAAAAHFAEAIARDAGYAAAYAGLATVRHWQANLYYLPADSAYEESRALAARALALDSTNVDGWMVLARLAEVRDRDFAAAETRYARAVAVAPSDARPYARRAILLARLGRPGEALASARRAVELDPASPATHSELARLYQELGRFEDAERELRVALSLDPGHPILLGNLGLELAHQKKFAEAATVIAQARAKVPDDVSLMGMHAFAHANLGRGAEARALLDSAEAAGLSPYNLAVVYELLGERERAIALLARAVRERDDGATALLDSTAMPSLRDDPRYRRLVGEVRARSR